MIEEQQNGDTAAAGAGETVYTKELIREAAAEVDAEMRGEASAYPPLYALPGGNVVEMVKLKSGAWAAPYSLKCHVRGCRHLKRGYLTGAYGGGHFVDFFGRTLADLRNQEYACKDHR